MVNLKEEVNIIALIVKYIRDPSRQEKDMAMEKFKNPMGA